MELLGLLVAVAATTAAPYWSEVNKRLHTNQIVRLKFSFKWGTLGVESQSVLVPLQELENDLLGRTSLNLSLGSLDQNSARPLNRCVAAPSLPVHHFASSNLLCRPNQQLCHQKCVLNLQDSASFLSTSHLKQFTFCRCLLWN